MFNTEYMQLMSNYARLFKPVICDVLNNAGYAWGIRSTIYTLRTPYQEYGWYIEGNGLGVVISINCDNPNRYEDLRSWQFMLGKPASSVIAGLGQQHYIITFPMTNNGIEAIAAYLNDWGPDRFAI